MRENRRRSYRRSRSRRLFIRKIKRVRDCIIVTLAILCMINIISVFINPEIVYQHKCTGKHPEPISDATFTPVIRVARVNIETVNKPVIEEETIEEIKEPTIPEKYSNIPLEDSLKEYIYNIAIESNIPPEILFSIAWKESNFNIDSISATNDYGLFQINQINFNNLASYYGYEYQTFVNDIDDPYLNTKCAVKILGECKDKYANDNWHQVLMRYNMGPAGADRNIQNGVYSSNYSRQIIEHATSEYGLSNLSL